MVQAEKGSNLQYMVNFQFHTLTSGIHEQLSTAGKHCKHERYRQLHRSFSTYNRLFYAQCSSSRKGIPAHLRRGSRYPFLLRAAEAVPLGCLPPGQVSPTDTTEMSISLFDIMLCPSPDSKPDLPGCLAASQEQSAGVFTRHYLIPIHTD